MICHILLTADGIFLERLLITQRVHSELVWGLLLEVCLLFKGLWSSRLCCPPFRQRSSTVQVSESKQKLQDYRKVTFQGSWTACGSAVTPLVALGHILIPKPGCWLHTGEKRQGKSARGRLALCLSPRPDIFCLFCWYYCCICCHWSRYVPVINHLVFYLDI